MSTLSATLVLVPVVLVVLVLVSLVIVSHDGHADVLGHAGDAVFVDDEEHVVAGDCLGRYHRRMDGQLTFASVLLKGELDVTDVRGLTVSRQPGADHRHSLDPSPLHQDRKSTRLNSSHSQISYAVFCLKKKKSVLRAHSV